VEQHDTAVKRYVRQAALTAEKYLLNHQSRDGFWRDYALLPGPSEDWITACTGLALVSWPANSECILHLRAAANALHGARRANGWGYDRRVPCDADSTAWTLRFLSATDPCPSRAAANLLLLYLDERGAAHTFVEPEARTWAEAHDDVTPVVGLALIAIGGPPSIIRTVRQRVLASQKQNGAWHAFWWATDAYATARSLEFLAASGGIPQGAANAAYGWLTSAGRGNSSFDAAQIANVNTLLAVGSPSRGLAQLNVLLDLQEQDGSWPASNVLLEPPREVGDGDPVLHADQARVMSTAVCLQALKAYL
jgi:hypothetical protein